MSLPYEIIPAIKQIYFPAKRVFTLRNFDCRKKLVTFCCDIQLTGLVIRLFGWFTGLLVTSLNIYLFTILGKLVITR